MSNFSFGIQWQFYQNSRSRIWMQGWRALLAFLVLILILSSHQKASAQGDYPGGYTLMPLQPGKIALLSMTVDVSFHDDGQVTIAEVQVNYRLHNRNKGAKVATKVAVPGYSAPKPAPKNITLQLNGRELPLEPGNQQWWLATVTLNPDQRANLVMTYSAKVGDGPLAHFVYPMDLTGQLWPGRLESARFTIAFPEPPNPQSWISLTPENYQLSAEAVTWSYDLKDPKQPIDFLFIRPSLWDQIQQARRRAAQENSPEAHKKLGAIYARLATATQNPAIFERYYPLAVASYAQAQQLAPDDTDAYLALAQLYQLRADLVPEDAASYTSLAINEFTKALQHGADDPAIQQKVVDGVASLVARARARGDFDAASAYLQRLEEVAQQYPQLVNSDAIQEQRRALTIDWARHVLEDQGPAPARTVLAQSLGPEIVQPPNAEFARINSLYVDVQTRPNLRTINLSAAMRENDLTLMNELAGSLARTNAADLELIEADPILLHIAIPFADDQDLLNRQRILADAIPPRPEWALLQAILRPQRLIWEKTDERWRTVEQYEEQISLVAVSADAGLQALSLDRAANSLDPADPLNALLKDIWTREAQLWRDLTENSRTRFTLTLYPHPGAPLEQSWSAAPGDELLMTGSAVQYHLKTVILLGLGAYLFFVLATWALFKL
ncbi:MAG TPA: hypothetical protein ENK30_02575, partial [Anaerolineae bacterium]|nr:hypothetical protein [Anaerolineae bacterium]